MLKSWPLGPQNMIVFGGRPFKEVIKIKWGPIGGSKSNMTSVLIRRVSFRNCGQKWKTGSWHSKCGLRPIASLRPGSLLEPQNPRYNKPGSVILTKSSGRTSWISGRVWYKMKRRIPRLKISKNFKTLAAGHWSQLRIALRGLTLVLALPADARHALWSWRSITVVRWNLSPERWF